MLACMSAFAFDSIPPTQVDPPQLQDEASEAPQKQRRTVTFGPVEVVMITPRQSQSQLSLASTCESFSTPTDDDTHGPSKPMALALCTRNPPVAWGVIGQSAHVEVAPESVVRIAASSLVSGQEPSTSTRPLPESQPLLPIADVDGELISCSSSSSVVSIGCCPSVPTMETPVHVDDVGDVTALQSDTQRTDEAVWVSIGALPPAQYPDELAVLEVEVPVECGAAVESHCRVTIGSHSASPPDNSTAASSPLKGPSTPKLDSMDRGETPSEIGNSSRQRPPSPLVIESGWCRDLGLLGGADSTQSLPQAPTSAESIPAECCFCQRRDEAVVLHSGHYLHLHCALWCPEVYCDPMTERLKHIDEALQRSQFIKCAWCRGTGASIGCVDASCQKSYHFHCAVEVGCRMRPTPPGLDPPPASIDEEHQFVLLCPSHGESLHRRTTEERRSGSHSSGSSGGNSPPQYRTATGKKRSRHADPS